MSNADRDVDRWESGELGKSLEHAVPVSPEEEAAIDAALGLKKVTIRLPIQLVRALEELAAAKPMAFPALLRQAITQYAAEQGLPANPAS